MKNILLLIVLYTASILGVLSLAHAQSSQNTCRNGWKTTCRLDSGGHQICTTRCR